MVDRQAKLLAFILPVVLGIVLAVWVSWPLSKFLSSAIPYTFSAKPDERVAGVVPGDHLQYLYHLHLLRGALDGKMRPFSNPYEFAGPYHPKVPYVYFPFAFPYAVFSFVSPAFGYNVLILLSFVATMAAGYGLARAWNANRGGAICAGIVLTLFPHRLNSMFGGHAAGSSFFLFPMAWWGLEKNWQTGRKRWGVLAGLSLMVMSIQDVHYLFFFCLLLPFWAIWKLLDEKAVGLPEATKGERLGLGCAISWQGIVSGVLLAASSHFHQVRMQAGSLVSPAFLGLLIFFLLAVLGVTFLMAVFLRWLGVKDGRFKTGWLSWPWASFLVMVGYFAADYVNKPGFGSKVILASLFLFVLCHLGFLATAILGKRLSLGRINVPWGRVLKLWPAAVGLAVALLYPLHLKFLVLPRSGVAGGRTLFEVTLFSIPCHKLFIRSPKEGTYLGWAFVGFILVGMVALAASRGARPLPEERGRLRISLVLTGLGVILACGASLGAVFPLYNVLYRFVPFLGYIRSTAKYLILTATGGAAAVALIVTLLANASRGRVVRGWLAPVVALVLILDWGSISKVGVSVLPKRNRLYEHVKAAGKGTLLLELPIWPGDSSFSAPYQYGTMLTGIPMINGYSPTVSVAYKENVADPLYSLNFGILGQKEFDLLKNLNVKFISFHEELFPRKVSALPATHSLKRLLLNPNLKLAAEENGAHLFEVASETYRDASGMPCDESSSVSYYVPYDLLKHQVGEERDDPDAIAGKAWASDGKKGFPFFGPFLMLPPGEYVAAFRVSLEASRELPEVGYLDVYTGEGTELATRRPLSPSDWAETYGYRFLEIPFQVTNPHPLQTRGFFTAGRNATVSLDFVLVKKEDTGESIVLEGEDFFSQAGRVSRDDKASQGICLRFSGPLRRGKPILEETFVFLRAGRYEARCAARGERGTVAALRMRRIGASPYSRSFDVQGGGEEGDFQVSGGSLNLATGGVYAISLWPVGDGLKAVDYISVIIPSSTTPELLSQ